MDPLSSSLVVYIQAEQLVTLSTVSPS
jgi:hypothetical protein